MNRFPHARAGKIGPLTDSVLALQQHISKQFASLKTSGKRCRNLRRILTIKVNTVDGRPTTVNTVDGRPTTVNTVDGRYTTGSHRAWLRPERTDPMTKSSGLSTKQWRVEPSLLIETFASSRPCEGQRGAAESTTGVRALRHGATA